MLVFVTGGARSGKSRAALEAARHCGRPVVFVATATVGDDEMAERIARHQDERPAGWVTVDAPRALAAAIEAANPDACVLVDCLSLWVTNELLADENLSIEQLDPMLDTIIAVAADRPGPTIIVSNEVGSGIVPDNALSRSFRDLLGRANQRVAAAADHAHLSVAGRLVELGAASGTLRV
ncbi:MAG: bifunctional adenosylcobinamide kinase/adenosylcobinamide-phosphate guanylyltransferase [Actinomycetota bacterium]